VLSAAWVEAIRVAGGSGSTGVGCGMGSITAVQVV